MVNSTSLAFFSYSRDDTSFAQRLAKDLRIAGAAIWLDEFDISPGERWDHAVEEALASCSFLLVILSPSSVESTNVMDEVSFALEEGKIIIPVLYRDCKIPFRLRRVQSIDFRSEYDNGIKELLKILVPVYPPEAPGLTQEQKAVAVSSDSKHKVATQGSESEKEYHLPSGSITSRDAQRDPSGTPAMPDAERASASRAAVLKTIAAPLARAISQHWQLYAVVFIIILGLGVYYWFYLTAHAKTGLPQSVQTPLYEADKPLVYVVEPALEGLVVEKGTLRIKAAALSTSLPITNLRVTFNGIQVSGLPEGGTKGLPEGGKKRELMQREAELEVNLRPGENVITFQAATVKARSQELTRHVIYRPPAGARAATAKPNLVLLAIGISDYTDPSLKLPWAAEDAREVYETFKRQEGRLFSQVEARLLPERKARAGRGDILSALDWFAGLGEKGDVRILFLSGHGTLDRYHNFYFLSQDQHLDGDPQLEGIPWNRFLDSLTAGSGRAVLMIDTCYAAAVKGTPRPRVDLPTAVRTLNSLYPGIVTFAASSESGLSVESTKWRHGAFTKALLEGLAGQADGIIGGKKDGWVDTLELSAWLTRRVAELTGDTQHPTSDIGSPPFPLSQVEP